jgi:hypothetical protein
MERIQKLMAKRCEHCPLCNYARENPDALIGKMVSFHGKFCPFWKAWQKEYGSKTDKEPTNSAEE